MISPREQWAAVRALDGDTSLTLGPNSSNRTLHDPKRLAFYLYRYKIAAQFIADKTSILDVGCGDGLGCSLFLQDTRAIGIIGIDFDQSLISYAKETLLPALTQSRGADVMRLDFYCSDFLGREDRNWGAITSIDCFEHIDPTQAEAFLDQIYDGLIKGGVTVIGTPNQHAAHLGSEHSKIGHINNQTPESLKQSMVNAGFENVFMLGVNDCTINVGHPHLWHYIFAIGVKD